MFGVTDYGAFCVAILVFLALPGPGTFALLLSTGKGGFKGGAQATFGLIAGDQVLLWLAVGGVAALLASHPSAFQAVQFAGAAYLAWIGARLIVKREGRFAPVHIDPGRYATQSSYIRQLDAPERVVIGWAGKTRTTAMACAIARIRNAASVPEGGAIGCVALSPRR